MLPRQALLITTVICSVTALVCPSATAQDAGGLRLKRQNSNPYGSSPLGLSPAELPGISQPAPSIDLNQSGQSQPAPFDRLNQSGQSQPAPLGRLNQSTQSKPAPLGSLNQAGQSPLAPLRAFDFKQLATSPTDLPNFKVVNLSLLRGGQPSDQGMQMLKSAGVRTVIDLRTETNLIENERRLANQLSMKFINIPMYVFQEPDNNMFNQFLTIVLQPANQPVYVHCLHGQDRTGTMIGAYRIAVDKWNADKAFEEMYSLGYRPAFANLTRGLYEFARLSGDRSKMPSSVFILSDLKKRLPHIK